ncbi:beta-1,4-glucuronyltransferase 1-like [Cylas formicarius]|uniref:beta-1,4-glucuronyltransferase 1-like n=1 Tax=Cylas formicarius TaxID=197179 RepID=UPI0029584CC6|nr:beta-1,4-glucuronyltransferase 1-like [Cylas formicarius]
MCSRRLRDGFYPFALGCAFTVMVVLLTSPDTTTYVEYVIDSNATVENRTVDDGGSKDPLGFLKCETGPSRTHVEQRGEFYVIYNLVKAEKSFGCLESITLSAPGDFRFLDNVVPLVDRWRGPISVALYAPGDDYFTTLDSISYLRNCETALIKEYVTFHVFFDTKYVPKSRHNGTSLLTAYADAINCSSPPPWLTKNDEDMFKVQNSLLYPINVARNVAKLAATTYFIFPSDIELYPTRDFIPLFLEFARGHPQLLAEDQKNVFVLPIFEVLENQTVPENKTQLQAMLKKKTAILFHQTVCAVCHRVVNGERWVRAKETRGLGVFTTGKRTGRYIVWEPFYVCTQKEPLWDERLTWEGQGNKMVQAYTLCLMDYNFNVLDNAFLIHKPGVKKKKVQIVKFKQLVKQSNRLLRQIGVELQTVYGNSSSGCRTNWVKVE